MIDIKPPEEERFEPFEGLEEEKIETPQTELLRKQMNDILFKDKINVNQLRFANKLMAEYEVWEIFQILLEDNGFNEKTKSVAVELHEISKTLKDILKEMRKRKA